MKELWFEQLERLESELGYTPSDDEVNTAVKDRLAELADRAKDEAKYERNAGTNRSEQPLPTSSGVQPRNNS